MATKKPPADPATMTASAINRELDRLDGQVSNWCTAMIDAGRGSERPSETRLKSDPLADACRRIMDRTDKLRDEIRARYVPYAVNRLPTRGFGPRRKR